MIGLEDETEEKDLTRWPMGWRQKLTRGSRRFNDHHRRHRYHHFVVCASLAVSSSKNHRHHSRLEKQRFSSIIFMNSIFFHVPPPPIQTLTTAMKSTNKVERNNMVQKVRMNLENDSNYTRWMWLIPTARNSSPFYRRWWRWLGWYALNKDKLSHHSVMWTIEEWWYLKKKRIKPMWSMDHTQRSRRSIIQFWPDDYSRLISLLFLSRLKTRLFIRDLLSTTAIFSSRSSARRMDLMSIPDRDVNCSVISRWSTQVSVQ